MGSCIISGHIYTKTISDDKIHPTINKGTINKETINKETINKETINKDTEQKSNKNII